MFKVLWKGLNHAFHLRQGLRLAFWRKKEKAILTEATSKLSSSTQINISCQEALSAEEFRRSIPGIYHKRRQMRLCDASTVAVTNDTTADKVKQIDIAERVVEELGDKDRGAQVDGFRRALMEAGIQKSYVDCQKMIRDLIPNVIKRDRLWCDAEKTVTAAIKAKHGSRANRQQMARELLQTLIEIEYQRPVSACVRFFEINLPGEHSRSDWTPEEEELLNAVESEHPGLAPKSLGKISQQRLHADLDTSRTSKACVSHIERKRKKIAIMASTVNADESAEKENRDPRALKKPKHE